MGIRVLVLLAAMIFVLVSMAIFAPPLRVERRKWWAGMDFAYSEWVDLVFSAMQFPEGRYDDQVDAVVYAYQFMGSDKGGYYD